jgi:AcrR family transcriptional regulator
MPKLVDYEARRLAITGVAASLIAKGGIEAATIRAIARESGYSKGVIEHFFENKEELIEGALTWANHRYEQRIAKTTKDLKGMDALRKRIEATIPHSKSTFDEWKVRLVFWGMAAIKPRLRKKQQRRFQLAIEYFESDLREAIENKQINPDINTHNTARHLVNSITGISTAALHNPSLYTAELIAQEIDYLAESVTR